MIQRPLLPVALLYLGGILLGNFVSFPLLPLFLLTISITLFALFSARFRVVLLCSLIFCVGVLNLTRQTAIVSPHDIRSVLGQKEEYLTLRGVLMETPYHRLYEGEDEPSARTLARLQVTEFWRERDEWCPVSGEVAVSAPGVLGPEYIAGRKVEVSGIISPPRTPVAAGLFDYRNYLGHIGVYHQLRVLSPWDWELVPDPEGERLAPVADRFFTWAKQILSLGLPGEDEPLRLLWAMTLGWKAPLTGEVSEPFMKSGTMHIFAISGLHIALIAGILVAVLRVLRVPRGICGFIVIPLIWFYTGVTGWQASAIRSTVMMSVVIAGWSLRRPSDLLNSLAAAALIILLWQPQQLFQASFQLSFFVVLSIALFSPVLDKIRGRLLEADPLLPDQLRPRWQVWLRKILYWVSASFTTSLAAWLGSIPLVAWYFHLFTPVSLLANVMVVPLSSLALASNLASIFVGGWLPALAELFNHSAWFFMLSMIRVSEWCACIPGGNIWVSPPTFLGVATYYSALVAVISGVLFKPRWCLWVGTGLLLLGGITFFQWQQARKATRITVLPLSGGSAVFYDAPGTGDDLLMDCGKPAVAERVTIPFLHAQGVNRLRQLVLTHGDVRNVGATDLIRQTFKVRETVTSSITFRSPIYREITGQLGKDSAAWKQVVRGDAVGSWRVLHPVAADEFAQADDASLVLASHVAGVRVLLLSDLGRPGQEALQSRSRDAEELRADIVITGLPVNSEPLGNGFLEVVKPQVIVVADSEYPATRRAGVALRDRLEQSGAKVFYTRDSGAVTITVQPGRWEVCAMDGTKVSGLAE